jgi:hypothetical protein
MNTEEIWNEFLKQAPGAKDPEFVVKLKARGLKALVNQAHAEGFKQGFKQEQTVNPLFDQIFGKRKR